MVKQRVIKSGLLLCAAILLTGQAAVGGTVYVDAGATGSNDGSSWTDAFNCLQDGIDAAVANDEIQVAAGSYCPDMGNGYVAGDREASFVLKNGIHILGGFPAGGGDRDVEANITVLSGDLLGNDEPTTETEDLLADPCRADNSYHVIVGQYCGPLTVLDGLTVTAGYANGTDNLGKGGGWFNTTNSSPTVTNCIFEKNAAALNGGGLYNKDIACKPPITDCEFRGNLSGTHGGGISCESNSFAWVISNNIFFGNVASSYGGGMYFVYSSPTVEDCEFTQNKAVYGGGLFTDDGCNITLRGCVLTENIATTYGGALYNHANTSTVEDCEFTQNKATSGGGLFAHEGCNINLRRCVLTENIATDSGGALYLNINTSTIENCEFVNNRASNTGGAIYKYYSSPEISDTLFLDNISVDSGGAIYNIWSHPIFTNCKFLANKTEAGNGGAVLNYGNSSPIFYNCIFSFNQSTVYSGGTMYNQIRPSRPYYYCSPKLYNCSLSWNTAREYGGGIYSDSSGNNIYLNNCILWNNVAANGSQQDLSAQIWGSTYHVKYSCIQGWSSVGAGNINTDPMFVNPAGEDWMYGTLDDNLRLLSGSPCIDAGDSTAVPVDITIDLDGMPRFYDDPFTVDTGVPGDPCVCVDMGAYEFGEGDGPVYFADANLKAAVEDALGVTDPTAVDMLALESLDASKRGIADLTGLEYAINLVTLMLNNNSIVDISPLGGLIKLETLYLYGNDIVDISAVSDLENLSYLHLSYNEIEVISDPDFNLSKLTKLERLYLHHNEIRDICPLAIPELTEFRTLTLYDNELLSYDSYATCIPQIEENNLYLTSFIYDPNCRNDLASDANNDCIIDIEDFAIMASEWLVCDYIYQELCP